MNTLITLLIIAAIVWFCYWLIDSVPLPSPINWIVKAIIAVLAIAKVLPLIGINF